MTIQKITPCLWFNDNAEEAVTFYTSIFKDSKIGKILRYDDESAKVSGRPSGSVLTIEFELFGQSFVILNGGPIFQLSEAASLIVNCETQEEIDYYWEKLSAVPESEQCGWAKDTFGLSWQIVPTVLDNYLRDENKEKAKRVMSAMLGMKKIIIADLKKAYEQE